MSRRRRKERDSAWAPYWFVALLLLLSPPLSSAQTGDAASAMVTGGVLVDSALVEARIEELRSADGGEGADNGELELYQSALNQLKSAHRDEESAAAFKRQIDNAGASKAKLDAEIRRAGSAQLAPDWISSALALDELEKRLNQGQAQERLITGRITELQALIAVERSRPEQAAEQAAEASRRLQEIGKRLKTLETGQNGVTAARRTELLATQQALRSLINRLEMERLSSAPRLERLRAEVELAELELQQARSRAQQLRAALSERRSAAADKASREAAAAEREALGKHDLVQAAAEVNSGLGRQLGELTQSLKEALAEQERVVSSRQRVERGFVRARQQLEIPSFGESMRDQLLIHRAAIPAINKLENRLRETERELAATRVAIFGIEDQRQRLQDDLRALEQGAEARPDGLSTAQWQQLKQELEGLLQARAELLDRLQATYGRYEKALNDLEVARGKLLDTVRSYANLLDRSLVWMPSAAPVDRALFTDLPAELVRFIDWAPLVEQLAQLSRSLLAQPVACGLLLGFVVVLVAARPRMRRALTSMSSAVGNVTKDRFALTFKALLLTLLLALPWVSGMFGLSALLHGGSAAEYRLSESLHWFGVLFTLLQVWRYLYTPSGLAQVHFRWNPTVSKRIHGGLRWITLVSLPGSAVLLGISLLNDDGLHEGVGRLVSLVWLALVFWPAHRMLRPDRGAGQQVRWWQLPLYLFTMTVLGGQILLLVQGYMYTSARLIYLLLLSGLAATAALLLFNLSVRWLLIAERRLALARARAKRLAAQEARAAKEAAEAAGESLQELPEAEAVSLATVSEQTRRILRLVWWLVLVALLFPIWSELMPALSRLDEIILWERTISGAAGEQLVPVSLWDVGLELLIIGLMIAAGRNLPGLLEIAVLQRLKLDRGISYAVTKATSYLIYTIGTVFALSILGVAWSDIQWLVAAMGVGLGFGLQEVFANFVSGLIILFERQIRIGDTVTIGDISGTVTRIHMRATTITDWDNKELIVPNKSFVTDPLINWTLSDETTRVVIRIGIAYGSDTKRAHELMVSTARSHPDVLAEPAPTVFFIGFGDSSLDFEVRCFVADRIKRMPLIHDLHMALEAALRDAEIEIPFPQRDLHLRSTPPGVFGRPRNVPV